MIAPVFGAKVTDKFNFRWTNDIVFVMTLTYAITFLWVGDGLGAFKKTFGKQQKEKM